MALSHDEGGYLSLWTGPCDHESMMRQREGSAEERLQGLLALQSLLTRVAKEIGPALELQPVLSAVLGAMRSLVTFRGGTIQLVENSEIYIAASDPPASPEVMAARLPVGTGLGGRVVATGEPQYSPNIQEDDRVDPRLRTLGSNAAIRSYLAVPLVCLGRVIGVMQVDSSDPDAFDADDLAVLEGLAAQVAGAIESARRTEAMMELERLKSDFLANVSHQLRTPLTIISGFTSTLMTYDGQLESRQQQQMLLRIDSAADRLQYLIEELLTVSQFEAGKILPHPTNISVRELLEDVRAHVAEPELVTVRAPDDLEATADPKLLRVALGHLVDNALRYAGDADLIGGRDEGTGAPFVEVIDHGPGIPDELGDRAFELFTRGSHTDVGMGLGLSLVRMIAGGIGAQVEMRKPETGGLAIRVQLSG